MRLLVGHAFNRGTGKSTVLANLAACLAIKGKRVCLVDACITSPSLHYFFGVDTAEIKYYLNDYLWGKCEIGETILDLTRRLRVGAPVNGELSLVTASPEYEETKRIMSGGLFVDLLRDGLGELADDLNPDVMIIDASTGLDDSTTVLISLADYLLVFLRPDKRDFLGTGVVVGVAEKLEVPDIELLVNQIPPEYDQEQVIAEVLKTYQHQVALALPYMQTISAVASSGLIVLHRPHDPAAARFHHLADRILSRWELVGE